MSLGINSFPFQTGFITALLYSKFATSGAFTSWRNKIPPIPQRRNSKACTLHLFWLRVSFSTVSLTLLLQVLCQRLIWATSESVWVSMTVNRYSFQTNRLHQRAIGFGVFKSMRMLIIGESIVILILLFIRLLYHFKCF